MGFSEIPLASAQAHVKTFQAFGWAIRRDAEHIIMTHVAHRMVHLSIPNHRQVKRGTLQKQIKAAGLSDKQYRQMFDSL